MNNEKKSKKPAVFALLAVLLGCFIFCGLNNSLSVSEITIKSDKVCSPFRIALVTDLHSCSYRNQQKELSETIEKYAPDIICLVGDIFDDQLADDQAEAFLAEIAGKYPCFYVTGNHEYWAGEEAFRQKMEILRKYGITRLSDECMSLKAGSQDLLIAGLNDPDSYPGDGSAGLSEALDEMKSGFENGRFTLLLSHRPEYFSEYVQSEADLVLCGHAHGGQWRLPWILKKGIYAPDQGIFPIYTEGQYTENGVTMIVSRGLAKESTRIPRFFNRPEIVMVQVQPG